MPRRAAQGRTFREVRVGPIGDMQWGHRLKKPMPTIRAATGMDKGAFQAVRPIHPDGERVITVREAARISGFPDCHLFANSIWQSFRMLGNAIPVPLSHGLLSAVASSIGAAS